MERYVKKKKSAKKKGKIKELEERNENKDGLEGSEEVADEEERGELNEWSWCVVMYSTARRRKVVCDLCFSTVRLV